MPIWRRCAVHHELRIVVHPLPNRRAWPIVNTRTLAEADLIAISTAYCCPWRTDQGAGDITNTGAKRNQTADATANTLAIQSTGYVFRTHSWDLAHTPTHNTPSHIPTYPQPAYVPRPHTRLSELLGCYEDDENQVFGVPVAAYGQDDTFRLEKCADECRTRHMTYMAMQDGNQCFCTSWLASPSAGGNYQKLVGDSAEAECDADCPLERGCGGANRNSVYQIYYGINATL